MPEPITIPISIVDITMEFMRPNLRLAMDRIQVVEQIFEAYRRWNVGVDDIEVITEGKPSEQGVKFKIPERRTSFFFGPSQCRLTQDDANWESADQTIDILEIGVGVLKEAISVEISTYKTAVSLHLQPKTTPYIHLLQPFAAPQLIAMDPSAITAFATVLKWAGRRVTLDGSAQLANGIFLRSERDFLGTSAISEILAQLRADEEQLFALIGVQEVLQ